MPTHRVSRGRESQVWLAEWFAEHGWTGADAVAASLPGKDIIGMPGWSCEMKATKQTQLMAAVRQAKKNAGEGEIPFAVYRPKGYGREKISGWIVALDLQTWTDLMVELEQWPIPGSPE